MEGTFNIHIFKNSMFVNFSGCMAAQRQIKPFICNQRSVLFQVNNLLLRTLDRGFAFLMCADIDVIMHVKYRTF